MRAMVAQGVRFRHNGKDPMTGLDCVHAPAWGVQQQGIDLPVELQLAMKSYSEQPDGWAMLAKIRSVPKYFLEIPVIDCQVPAEAEPGDLLQMYVFRNPKHMAILSSRAPLSVIEAWRAPDKKIGKLLEQPLDFRRRVAACFRILDIA